VATFVNRYDNKTIHETYHAKPSSYSQLSCCLSEPSLATWYYLIQGCYTTDGKTCNICSFSFQYW